jgi:hypothetical protein
MKCKMTFLWRLYGILLAVISLTTCGLAQVSFYLTPTIPYDSYISGDFNGDGNLDLVGLGGTVLLGTATGTFTPGTPVSLPSGTSVLLAGDVNDDGKLDLITWGSTFNISVLLGNGDGTFQAPINTYVAIQLNFGIAVDLNNDGKVDLVATSNDADVLVYLSNGDGTFAGAVTYPVPQIYGLISGDFNGDGKQDIATSSNAQSSVSVLLGNGDGTLQAAKTTSLSLEPLDIVAGDVNNDGKLDLVGTTNTFVGGISDVYTLLGNGDGTFQAPTTETAIIARDIALADFNGDGKLDVAVSGGTFAQFLTGNGDGTFAPGLNYYLQLAANPSNVIVGDFNHDGKADVETSETILLGNGDGTFQGTPAVTSSLSIQSAITGDFNGDGKPDMAVATENTSANIVVNIQLGDGKGNLEPAFSYTLTGFYGTLFGPVDLNGDGKQDLVCIGFSGFGSGPLEIFAMLGNGDGSFGSPITTTTGFNFTLYQVAVGDFNGDGKPDIAITGGDTNVYVLLGNGDGTFASPVSYFAGATNSVFSADFNNDGKLDLAVAGNAGIAIMLGNGDGSFQSPNFFITTNSLVFATADVNNDHNADLLADGSVYLGNGNGTFKVISQPSVGGGLLADINGDGKLDLIGSCIPGSGEISYTAICLGNGDGTFGGAAYVISTILHYTSALFPVAVADFNVDGKPDVVLGYNASGLSGSSGGLAIYLNTTPAGPNATISPASLNLGSIALGSSSKATTVTVTNQGSGALTVSSVTIGGAKAAEFSQTNNCTTVQPPSSCTINVTFTPDADGAAAASLMIADNATGSPQVVALSGTGTGAGTLGFGIPSGGSSSETVSAGGTAKYALSIGGAGMGGQTSITCSGAPTGAACTVTPSSLNVSATSPSSIAVSVTTASSAAVVHSQRVSWMLAEGILGFALLPVSSKKRRMRYLSALSLAMILMLSACGGGGGSGSIPSGGGGTPSGTYPLTVTATPTGGTPQSVKLTLIVQLTCPQFSFT